jgi:hypothetical protein
MRIVNCLQVEFNYFRHYLEQVSLFDTSELRYEEYYNYVNFMINIVTKLRKWILRFYKMQFDILLNFQNIQ